MKLRDLLLYSILLFIFIKCASVQPPPGGPKDEKEPELISTIPVNGSKNFKGKSIQFIFNEDVQLDNIFKQLLITPITEELKYESRVKKNRVILNFENDFSDSTTYSINLRDAVVDVTEKNIAKNVRIAFSTGNFIDSMSVTGRVSDLYTGISPEEAVVMLFRPEDTINVQDPYYLSKTDEDGNYLLENIKVGDYQIYALEESDNNYKYTKDEEEKIGFITDLISIDSLIENLDFKVAEYDNVELDFRRSSSRNQYVQLNFTKPIKDVFLTFEDSTLQDSIVYAIENDIVRLYSKMEVEEKEEEKKENISKKERKKKEKRKKKNQVSDTTSIIEPIQDSIVAYIKAYDFLDNEIIDTTKFIFINNRIAEPEQLVLEIDPKSNDKKISEETFDITLSFNKPITRFNKEGIYLLNIRDTTLYKLDSIYNNLIQSDTLIFEADSTLLIEKSIEGEKKWKDTVDLRINDSYIIDYQKLTNNYQKKLIVDKTTDIIKDAVRIEENNNTSFKFSLQYFNSTDVEIDTNYYEEQVTDSLAIYNEITSNHLLTEFYIKEYNFNPLQQIYIDSTAFISIEDDSVSNTVIKYESKNAEDYGTLGGTVSLDDSVSFFLQILNDKYELEQELYNISDFRFEYVQDGSKYLRLQIDNNKNGIWEKGSFLNRIPPEEVFFRSEGPLDLRPNWEILDINISQFNLSTYQQNKKEN